MSMLGQGGHLLCDAGKDPFLHMGRDEGFDDRRPVVVDALGQQKFGGLFLLGLATLLNEGRRGNFLSMTVRVCICVKCVRVSDEKDK